jgi:hypothetical protein
MSDFSIDNISGVSHFTECGGMDVCSDGNLCSLATGAIVIDERRSLNCNCFPKNKRRRDAPLFAWFNCDRLYNQTHRLTHLKNAHPKASCH